MQSKEANYFTAGELAAIFSISKQTLLYYDKIGLLSPEFVSENGYRHYSISQYLILEIIVNLRNLNISISNIKEYINARNKNMLIKILEEKRKGMWIYNYRKRTHSKLNCQNQIQHYSRLQRTT